MLEEYIQDQITALKELYLWNYLNDEEKEELRQAPTKGRANVLMRTFRDKYYDVMLEEFENGPQYDFEDTPIEELGLKTKTLYSLLRCSITTISEFMDHVQDYGWSTIQSFGVTAAKDMYSHIFDMSEDEINKLVKETRYIKNKGE
jgi:hypothetical protein